VLRKGDIKMIKKLLEKSFSKSAIARKLGLSRVIVERFLWSNCRFKKFVKSNFFIKKENLF